jgi:hypothetical protein
LFDHYTDSERRRRTVSPRLLLLATASMIGVAIFTIYAVAWLMSALGFRSRPLPVEVTYDPFEDGSTLEQVIGGDVPPPIEDSGTPPR